MESVSSTSLLPEDWAARDDVAGQIGLVWELVRTPVIVPLLKVAVVVCLAMALMLFVERVYMGVALLVIKLLRRRPERQYRWEPIRDDVELGNAAYPMVLVQIPMYNEREVYKFSIGAACGLSWPSDRIVIQVLDDSTDPVIQVSTLSQQQPIRPPAAPPVGGRRES